MYFFLFRCIQREREREKQTETETLKDKERKREREREKCFSVFQNSKKKYSLLSAGYQTENQI